METAFLGSHSLLINRCSRIHSKHTGTMAAAATIRAAPVDKFAVAKDMFFNQPDGFPYDGFNPDQVVLPPGDDCGVISDDDDIGEEDIQNEETGFSTSIALDGLPKVGEDKFDKLVGVLKKRFEPHGEIREGCFWMPTGDDGITKGYAFIEYSKREEAAKAVKEMDQHKLDKLHLIRCYRVDDLDRLRTIPEEYTQPEKMAFDEEKSAGAMTWLMDRRGRDQFVIQHDRQHKVCWNDPKKACAELFHQRSAPTEWSPLPLIWSPQGTYICSLHPPLGAALWSSKANGQFERVMKFPCPDVTKADFSAHEEYITLYSVVHRRGMKIPDMLISVFDVQSGRKLRTLQENLEALLVGAMRINQQELLVPFLMWSSAKPAYAARLAANAVYVYNGADMTLLDKKPIAVEGAHDARWSPSQNMLAVYQEEHNNMPARVAIYSLPSKQEIRAKSLFMVHEVHMFWHAQSKYLAVHVAKHTKSKKTTFATIELFTFKSKTDVINDVLELPNKGDKVLQIAWEPKGDRFAVIHGDMGPGSKFSVSFFTMLDKTMKQGAKLLGTITGRNVSELHWSPAGRNIILAGISSTQGALEFFNVDDMSPLRSQQHFMCNNVKWDQTGRYACSWVDAHRDMDHGYIIWSFTGELLYRESLENFWNFAWRPRPPSQLPPEKDRELAKNLRSYAKRYEEEDELLMAAAGSEQLQRRQQLRVSWEAWSASKEEWRQRQLEHFTQVLGYVPQELPSTMTEKVIEQVIDVKEEPYTAS